MGRYLFIILYLFLSAVRPAAAAISYDNAELISGYFTVINEKGKVILQTGHEVHPGDEYISEDNRLYEITVVEGTLARAHYVRDETLVSFEALAVPAQAPLSDIPAAPEMPYVEPPAPAPDIPPVQPSVPPAAAPTPPPEPPKPLISIYHTHTDESYTPTDGQPTQPGKGSIMLVGDAFSQRLQELGYQTDHSKNLHDPHDANAYQRSRRTFMELLQKQPVALFDIHRDSAPLPVYQTTINGQEATKILLVVGRQNQNRDTTMQFAKTIKAAADSKYPGLIRGIFIAHGNYNQDISPRAMLVEIGTQYNTRQAAERSAALFADVVPLFLSAGSGTQTASASNGAAPYAHYVSPGNTYLRDIAFIIAALIIGIIGYLYLSTGSWQEAKRKLTRFSKYEFTNFLGPRRKRKD